MAVYAELDEYSGTELEVWSSGGSLPVEIAARNRVKLQGPMGRKGNAQSMQRIALFRIGVPVASGNSIVFKH